VYNYHLKKVSNCIDKGNPYFVAETGETDIDGENRIIDGDFNGTARVDMGADEFKIVDFVSFSSFANAWRTTPNNSKWNAVWDFVADNIIDIKDLAVFAGQWLLPSDRINGGEFLMSTQPEQEQQSLTENIFDSNEQMAESQEEQQSEYYYTPDYNLPAIYLTCDNNTPEPNDEVTVYVHTDTPLFALNAAIYVIGDVNITSAMNGEESVNYGWDGWYCEPYIDSNWVEFGNVRWDADANGTVGYVKFRYHSGQVNVYIDPEWSEAFYFDWDSRWSAAVPFSQETILICRDPNEP
jgi:hypothetical protein